MGQVVRTSHGESCDREIDEATERGAQETDDTKNQQRPPESRQSGSEGTAEEGAPTGVGTQNAISLTAFCFTFWFFQLQNV